MSRLVSDYDDFYMADRFERDDDCCFYFAPQGTSDSASRVRGVTANCCSIDTADCLTAATAYCSDGISALASAIDTKVDCSSFTSSIDKVGKALKQLSDRLGFSLDMNGNIVDVKRDGFKNAIKGRLKRSDLLTLS